MKYIFTFLFFSLPVCLFSQQQYQHWEWAKSFGGSGNDQTTDMKMKNGFLYVTGTFTSSQIKWDETILTSNGGEDIFVAKLDTKGNTVWVKSFGGNGDDKALQLEINSAGSIVLRCTSGSPAITFGNSILIDPANFYMLMDIDGNVLNAVALPVGPTYPDIDIDNSNSVYLSASYFQPFNFAGALIDSSCGLAGAALLKYSSTGNALWYKNVQVRSNKRYEMYDDGIIDPLGPPVPVVITYTPAITGDASAAMKIEYNEHDSVIGIICSFSYYGFIENYELEDSYTNARRTFQLKCTENGTARTANFFSNFATFAGNWTDDFKTSLSGYTYTTSGYLSLSGFHAFSLTKERNNVWTKTKDWGYSSYQDGQNNPPTAFSPMEPDETGNYLLCSEVPSTSWPGTIENRNIVILDSNLEQIKKTDVPEINRLPLFIKCMADTNSIFIGSTFSDGDLTVNAGFPNAAYTLTNKGQSEIFIGKYAFKVCSTYHNTQNMHVCRNAAYQFPDKSIITNIISDISYTSVLYSTYGCDSIITTNIIVTAIDTSITKNNLHLQSNATASSYQWLDCISGTAIAGATAQTYTAAAIGSYAVAVSSQGCTDTSSCYTITATDIKPGGRPFANVYPVPTRGHYTLIVQAERPTVLNLSLLDFTGQQVRSQKTNLIFGKNIIEQNISSLAPGRYTLVIKKGDTNEVITKTIIRL